MYLAVGLMLVAGAVGGLVFYLTRPAVPPPPPFYKKPTFYAVATVAALSLMWWILRGSQQHLNEEGSKSSGKSSKRGSGNIHGEETGILKVNSSRKGRPLSKSGTKDKPVEMAAPHSV